MQVSRTRVAVGTAVFVAAFWLGAETAGPPADWILGFTVLGTACWIGLPNLTGSRPLSAAMRSRIRDRSDHHRCLYCDDVLCPACLKASAHKGWYRRAG